MPIRVFHFSTWKRQNKEETGDRMYGELALSLLWRPWQPQLLPLETTCLFILLSKRIHHVESLNSFSKRKTWWHFFLSLIIHYCLIYEPFEGSQTREATLCPPLHPPSPSLASTVISEKTENQAMWFGSGIQHILCEKRQKVVGLSFSVRCQCDIT